MANYLITGVSSGIGRELTKKLIGEGHKVVGIARRVDLLVGLKKELKDHKNFTYLGLDLASETAWQEILRQIKRRKFIPNVVIFNAAIFQKDYLDPKLDLIRMKQSFEINFFSIIEGFEHLIDVVKPKTQFIFISSSSAFKGSRAEGVGYPASKAALSIAFESLYQKYKSKFHLKIIYFGPIKTDMLPSASKFTPVLSLRQATDKIIKVINSDRVMNYSPRTLFLFLRFIKIIPEYLYLTILDKIDILHLKSMKK